MVEKNAVLLSYKIQLRYVRTIDCRKDVNYKQTKLTSISWLNDNTFVVVDETNEKVTKYDIDGNCIKVIPVESVLSVTCKSGRVYCGIKSGQIKTIDNDNNINTIVTLPRFCQPVALDERVLAVGSKNIYTITRSGTSTTTKSFSYVPIVNKNVNGFYKLRPIYPHRLKKDRFVVSDWNSRTVHLIKDDGEVANEYRRDDRGDDWFPGGLACDNMGNIYIAGFKKRDVTVINADMEYIDTLQLPNVKGPRCMACSTSNKLLVTCDYGVALFDILFMYNQQQK